ncbi:protein transport protein SEC9 [Microdochium nivale]|nr:protein transport protein SEC9 [Microdochium nivale]
MKKFGFGKKDKSAGGDDDQNRNALFGKKSSSGPPQSDNPYAQAQPANDPYMDGQKYMSPYQQARNNIGPGAQGPGPQSQGPSPGQHGRPSGLPSGPGVSRQGSQSSTATAPPPYSNAPPAGGYANDRYGAPSGYGGNKYANPGGPSGGGPQRSGGYGGLGRTDSNDTDDNRDALFSGAKQRQDQHQGTNNNAYGANSAGAGGSKYGGYGEERQLTAEEQEDREADDIKSEIHDIRQQSKQTVMNSEAITNQILENASATYARLGAQHERLNYTEQQLDHGSLAARHARTSGLKELQYYNRSMWNPGVKNPFSSGKRNAEYEKNLLDQNQQDRATRETTRKEGFAANQNMEQGFKSLSGADPSRGTWKPTSAAERSKYTFEEGESDEEEIDQGLERLSNNVHKINLAARLIGNEIDSQNDLIDRLGTKSDALSDTTVLNTATLQKIARKG